MKLSRNFGYGANFIFDFGSSQQQLKNLHYDLPPPKKKIVGP